MTTRHSNWSRWRQASRLAAALGLVAVALAAWRTPASLAPAWRCAVFACVGPAMGSLVFLLFYELTGGEWGRVLRPFLLSATRLLPWAWLLLLPLLFVGRGSWTGADAWHYSAPWPFAIRAVIYGGVFFLVAAGLARNAARDGTAGRRDWLPPLAIIGLVFMTHLLVTDWLATADAGWHSTAFPLVWLSGQGVAGLAVAILAALARGADPTQSLGHRRSLGIDWGSLLLAAAMFWCYVAYAQFLIVWSGNLPNETSWYLRRAAGAWRFVPGAVILLHFVFPLGLLLSRRAKQNRRVLGVAAGVLLVAQWLLTAWVILPAYPGAANVTAGLALVLTLALVAVGARFYVTLGEKEFSA